MPVGVQGVLKHFIQLQAWTIRTEQVILGVSELFLGHGRLLVRFGKFLPQGYPIKLGEGGAAPDIPQREDRLLHSLSGQNVHLYLAKIYLLRHPI